MKAGKKAKKAKKAKTIGFPLSAGGAEPGNGSIRAKQ
jgi:hypothetical protein